MFKVFIVAVLVIILGALGSGFYYILKDKGNSDRAVKALTIRIALSVALFALVMLSAKLGYIHPTGGPFH